MNQPSMKEECCYKSPKSQAMKIQWGEGQQIEEAGENHRNESHEEGEYDYPT